MARKESKERDWMRLYHVIIVTILNLSFESFQVLLSRYREVPEWLKGPAWKAGIGATLSRVRIPSSLQ